MKTSRILLFTLFIAVVAINGQSPACVMWFPPIFELQTVDFGGRLDAASSLSDCWNACLNNAQCILFNWDGNAPHGQRCFISTIDIFQFNFTYHGFYRNCLLNAARCEVWTAQQNTSVSNGQLVTTIRGDVAYTEDLGTCLYYCYYNESCTGFDWNASAPPYERCRLSGPWSGARNNGTSPGVTHYDYSRNCLRQACIIWTLLFEIDIRSGKVNAASTTVWDCWKACVNNPQCNGIRWEGGSSSNQSCWLTGNWSGTSNVQVNFDLNRTCLAQVPPGTEPPPTRPPATGATVPPGTYPPTVMSVRERFLPYGPAYDNVVYFFNRDDGYSRTFYFRQKLLFGCQYYRRFWVHVNGLVSLNYPLYANLYPYLYRYFWRRLAVIAPFWADIDLRYTNGVVYLGHVSRYSAEEVVSTQAAETFDAVKSLVLTGAGDTGFLPTEVVTVTWLDVSPWPSSYWYYRLQKASFQLVMASDYRSGRSYVMFNYDNIGWSTYRAAAQGYRDSTTYRSLFTSYTSLSYQLPTLTGNTGRPGQWLFHTSNRYCEGRQISYSYRCRRWYIREQYRYWNPYWFYYGYYYYYYYYYYYWNPFRRLRPCPCWWRQARWDWRYRVDWRTRCATHRFGFSTTTQLCCYGRRGQLLTVPSYEAGSALLYNPRRYYSLHYQYDLKPKQWCCLYSDNCYLYYRVRPLDRCFGYRFPRFAVTRGDPHIQTLDNLDYTFNGLGEYFMVKSESFELQARTARAWDSQLQPSLTGTVFSAVAGRALYEESNTTVSSARVHVEMSADRTTGLIIMVDDTTNLTSWFLSEDDEIQSFNGVELSKRNESLVVSFNTDASIVVTLRGYQLDIAPQLPSEFKNKDIRGLLGNYNDVKSDDLISRTGQTVPADSTEETIHYDFGETWRITPLESLFYYDVANGFDYDYYNSSRSYTPLFGIKPTQQQVQEAQQVCTVNGELNRACEYDYYATGNAFSSGITAKVSSYYVAAQNSLANNVPFISVNGNGSLTRQWIVLEPNSVTFSTSDPDNDTVKMYGWQPLPSGSNLSQVPNSDLWEFVWTPMNVDPVELVFSGNDTRGGQAAPLTITVQLCNCSQHGECMWDELMEGFNSSDTFQIVACDCEPLYEGDYCENTTDLCESEPCGENGTCVYYTNNTYRCTACAAGYEVAEDQRKCIDINECNGTNECNTSTTECVNEPGTYSCRCLPGFCGPAGSRSCNDIDECKQDICDQQCTNFVGSYNCSCYSGYHLENDNKCVAEGNLCDGANCEQFCADNSTATCGCRSGYTVSGSRCTDVDECLNATDNKCSSDANCINTNGSYMCECPAGSMLLADQRTCDECPTERWGKNCENYCRCEVCDKVAGCTSCDDPGWTGPNCDEDVDECNDTLTNCGTNSDCTNMNGSFICDCHPWYQRLSGQVEECVLLDACEFVENGTRVTSPRCQNNGNCVNGTTSASPGSFECNCALGFTGTYCERDIDNCTDHKCVNGGQCIDLVDDYRCECSSDTYGRFCQHRTKKAADVDDATTLRSTTNVTDVDDATTLPSSESTATDLSSIIAFSVVGGFFGIAIGVIIYIILRRYFGGQAAVLAARPSAGWSRVSAVPNRNQKWQGAFPVQNVRSRMAAPYRTPGAGVWRSNIYKNY